MRQLLILVAALVAAWPCWAASPLTDHDRADVAQAEAYLNSLTSLKARFYQVSDGGGQAEGAAYLLRPGRLRLQYDPPSPLLLVADGSFLIVDDKRYDNPSYIPLGSTPAGILVGEHIKLTGGDLTVTRVHHAPGVVSISVVRKDDPGEGQLTLVFADKPFELRQWRVTDAEGQNTTVSLFEVRTGQPLDDKLFVFKPREIKTN